MSINIDKSFVGKQLQSFITYSLAAFVTPHHNFHYDTVWPTDLNIYCLTLRKGLPTNFKSNTSSPLCRNVHIHTLTALRKYRKHVDFLLFQYTVQYRVFFRKTQCTFLFILAYPKKNGFELIPNPA